jgi:hypothetical protein
MTISTGSLANPCAVPTGHAYTLVGAVSLLKADGTVAYDLLKIRNPWGSDTHTCAFNDKDAIWTANPSWATQVSWVNSSADGYFYMTKEDVARALNNIVVGFIYDGLTPSTVFFSNDANTRSRFMTFSVKTQPRLSSDLTHMDQECIKENVSIQPVTSK